MLGIADEIAQQYLSRVRIKADFISSACPFHKGGTESHVSFWISRTSGKWGCFTCGEGGSDLRWLLKNLGVRMDHLEDQLEEAVKEAKRHQERDKLRKEKKARKIL